MAQLREKLQRHGDEGEGGGAEEGEDDIGAGDVTGLGHPHQGEVAGADDGHEEPQREEELLGAVEQRGGDGGEDEADDDEDGAADAGLVVGEAVGGHDLVEERGERVEETDKDEEGHEDQPQLEGVGEDAERLAQTQLGRLGRRANGGRRCRWDEEGRQGAHGGLFF